MCRLRLAAASPVQYPTKAERRKYAPPLAPEWNRRLAVTPVRRKKGARPARSALPVDRRGRPGSFLVPLRRGRRHGRRALRHDRLDPRSGPDPPRAEGDKARTNSVLLTESFIDDMDSSLRQIGIGDFVVGKHVGRLMGALGGRLDAYRSALAGEGALGDAVRRNVFRDDPPSAECGRVRRVRAGAIPQGIEARPGTFAPRGASAA